MNTELRDWEVVETTEEVELETATGFATKSDVRAGQCPSSTYPKKERGDIICVTIYPC
jgi:hypothetical protein